MKYSAVALMAFLLLAGCSSVIDAAVKMAKILYDPSIPVGSQEDQPTQISLSLYAADDVNPNPFSEDRPPAATDADTTSTAAPSPTENDPALTAITPQPLLAESPRGIGEYGSGMQLSPLSPGPDKAPAPQGTATLIAFKILQLKDDSLLLNADPTQLRQDFRKALGSTYILDDDYVLLPQQFKHLAFAPIRDETRYIAVIASFHDINGAIWKQSFKLEPKGRRYALMMLFQGKRAAIIDETIPAISATVPKLPAVEKKS